MAQEITAVLVDEIAFAVKKDGSIISNLSKNGKCEPEHTIKIFEGLNKLAEQATNDELVALAMAHMIFGRDFPQTMIKRMEKVEKENSGKTEK